MGSFKPMVKMMTTEPSIELKLKKGGHVAMPKMKSKDESGHKKMAMGGMPPAMDRAGLPPGPVGGAAPAVPSMAARRKAMKMRRPMKDGGTALQKHADMPASKAHKGLKTGGVAMGQGGFKSGGSVKMAMGGKLFGTRPSARLPAPSPTSSNRSITVGNKAVQLPAKGSMPSTPDRPTTPTQRPMQRPMVAGMAKAHGGIIKSTKGETMMHTAKPDHSPAKTGGVKMGNGGGYKKGGLAGYAKGGGVEGNVSSSSPGVTNTTTGEVRKGHAGGYKKGGAPKKFARGGSVNDSGKAEKMPQGYKKPPTPVSINQLSGTYKKGGKVKKYAEGGVSDKEQSDAYNKFYADEAAENKAEREAMLNALKNPLDAIKGLPERLKKGYEAISKGLKGSGSVTTTEREISRTVTPTKKRYGGAC